MKYKNEKIILKIIKFTPPIFITTISLLIMLFLYYDYKSTYSKEKEFIEKEFIYENKRIIKNNVEIAYNTLIQMQENTEKELKKSIKERVYEAYAIAMNIYNENKDKDKKTVTKMIKDALANIKFNDGRGYFYIYSFDYKCILFPPIRSNEGKDFYDFQESKGKYLTRDIIAQLKKQNEGFMSWYFYKPSDIHNYYKKIGFNKYFEPFGWFIGTGEYLDEFEESVKNKALKYIKSLKYLDNNYIFILDYEGTYLSHIKSDIIGKKELFVKDVENSKEKIQKLIEIGKSSHGGYFGYVHHKPETNLPTYKISFIKGIDKWKWILGQGFYEDDYKIKLQEKKKELENKFNSYIKNVITISLVLMLILLIISMYISKILQKKFDRYKNEIKEHLKENTEQQEVLAHQSKMAAMGEMIGNIAHQWRQPLSVITTAASGVKINKELDSLDDKTLLSSMDSIVFQANYLSKTIEDFRNFLKVNHDKMDFHVIDAILDAIKLTEVQFKNKGIDVITKLDELTIYGVKNQFIQVIINILNNAKDELLKLENQEKLILIKSYTKDHKAFVTIQDNAGGIPESIINRVFEPYFSTKHQFQGTGIGLYMSQEIICKILKGEIIASNEEFEYKDKKYFGAKFTIEVPL